MKIGFIDYYIDEWHANNYPAFFDKAGQGKLEVTHAYSEIDSPFGGKSLDQWCNEFKVVPCTTIEEVVVQCDGVIVLSPDNCEMHEKLAEIPLKSGKIVYVDKTFAPSKASAERMFQLAKQHGTSLCSFSALRFAPEYGQFTKQNVCAIQSIGPGMFENYSIHQLEPLMMLMKSTPLRVIASHCNHWVTLLIEFDNGKTATITTTGNYDVSFSMTISTKDKTYPITIESDFFSFFSTALVDFFTEKIIPVDSSQTISIMALREAGLKAIASPSQWQNI